MLAGGKEDVGRAERIAAAERSDPMIAVGNERFDRRAAEDLAAVFFGAREQGCVENAARERERLKGKGCGDRFAAGGKAKGADGRGAKIQRVNAGLMEIVDGLAAEELAADFVMRAGFFFDEHDVAACGGEAQGDHGAGGSAADDEMIDVANGGGHCVLLRLTQRRAGKKG